MKQSETAALLNIIQNAYPAARFDESALATWHDILGTQGADVVMAAFRRCAMRSPEYAPSAYAVLGEIENTQDTRPSPDECWTKLQKMQREISPDHQTTAERIMREFDPDAADVLADIGWWNIAMTSVEYQGGIAKTFKETLKQRRSSAEREPLRKMITSSGGGGVQHITTVSSEEPQRIAISDAITSPNISTSEGDDFDFLSSVSEDVDDI